MAAPSLRRGGRNDGVDPGDDGRDDDDSSSGDAITMSNDETRKGTSDALAAAKASLKTARMSLVELERLRDATRGPLPDVDVVAALVGRDYDETAVQAVLFPLSLRHRTLMGGLSEAASKNAGIRVVLDSRRRIESIGLAGDGVDGGIAWTGTWPAGLSSSSRLPEVRRALGRGVPAVVDGVGEEQFNRAGLVFGFVFHDDVIAELRLRRSV